MYSVIIQNQKTMDAFSQYQSLFFDAINSNRIGICKWIESGTTIDTALPELGSLTDDKKEWRAVIVRYIDENCMAAYETDPRNPYDFLVNKKDEDSVEESPVPLVRLTQMLGGVPPLEVKFTAEIVQEDHKAPRTIYVPVEDVQREQQHKKLVEKYRYDGKPPSAILIISIRDKCYQEESIEMTWRAHKESDSSEFWKRNHFPSICRFLTYDYERQGPIQKNADDFCFWYSVMLMSINEWDSSTIQAYRLYSVELDINNVGMEESFQEFADRLRDAKHSINKNIKKDIESHIVEEALPEYRIDIPVVLNLPVTEERTVKERSFPVLSSGMATDIEVWSNQRREVEKELASAVRSAERTLDQTAGKMRTSCSFDEEEVLPLNKYQVEDLSREIWELRREIVNIQGTLPKENIAMDEDVREVVTAVTENLQRRVKGKPAIVSIVIVMALVILSAIPAIEKYISQNTGSVAAIICVVLTSIFLVIVSGMLVLLFQKSKFNKLIKEYNQQTKKAFNKLVEKADDYSVYMSDIANHSRGSSYLMHSERRHQDSDAEHYLEYKHIKAINILLNKLSTWSKAFHLNTDFTTKRPETRIEVDTSVSPTENKLYTFETGSTYSVDINNSGMSMESPYCFARGIIIVREELYGDE